MAGPTQRTLTLTEELDKLEQSITLTLQEIDSNFARAHRIVTTSILPIVEQYAEHSKQVWEGAKFWKQFFEASANVSLSGYEEQPESATQQQEEGETVTEDATENTTHTSLSESEEHVQVDQNDGDGLDISSLTISPSHSTPRPPAVSTAEDQTISSIPSPGAYKMPRPEEGRDQDVGTSSLESPIPVTPGRKPHDDDPMSSPLGPPPTTTATNRKQTDPVLHRVLDKTYRVQATPLSKGGQYRPKFKVSTTTPAGDPGRRITAHGLYDSPPSSPEPEVPKLHEEIFDSPIRGVSQKKTPRQNKHILSSAARATPKPGISVLTPVKPRGSGYGYGLDDDDDDDDIFDASPPKTMQFHIPQSRLLKTPAKEASKRIVSGILATAGADSTADHDLDIPREHDAEEHSPTVVGARRKLEDETDVMM